MRKIVVNDITYNWYVKRTGKHERTISIKGPSKEYCSFMFDGNITPRMIREYIISNPSLEKVNMSNELSGKIYEASTHSLLKQASII